MTKNISWNIVSLTFLLSHFLVSTKTSENRRRAYVIRTAYLLHSYLVVYDAATSYVPRTTHTPLKNLSVASPRLYLWFKGILPFIITTYDYTIKEQVNVGLRIYRYGYTVHPPSSSVQYFGDVDWIISK